MHRTIRARALAGAALLSLIATAASAQTFTRLVVFGDSLSDNGNLATATNNAPGAPGYPSLRFSNGPVAVEYLNAQILGQPAPVLTNPAAPGSPLMATIFQFSGNNALSVDSAFGGSRTDTLTDPVPPGIPTQINTFVAKGGAIGAANVVSIQGGANDIFQQFLNGRPAPLNPANPVPQITTTSTAAANNLGASITQLAALGAKTIIVQNLPDLAITPLFNGALGAQLGALAPLTTLATQVYDTQLAANLSALAKANPGVNIISVNEDTLLKAIIANPSAFGYTDVTRSCVNTPSCLAAPISVQNTYLFYDAVHPTTRTHQLNAQALFLSLYAPTFSAYTASLGEIAENERRTDTIRNFERLRERGETASEGRTADLPRRETVRGAPDLNEFFVGAIGQGGNVAARGNRFGYDYATGGVTLGYLHTLPGTGFTLGVAGAAQTGRVSSGPNSTTRYDNTQISGDALIGYRAGGLFINADFGGAYGNYGNWTRKTFIGPLVNTASSNGATFSAGGEAGYDLRFGALTVTPSARLTYLNVHVDRFTESGIVAPIAYNARNIDALAGAVELRAAYDVIREPGRALKLYALVGYEDFLTTSGKAIGGVLANNTAQPFSQYIGAPIGEGVLVGGGVQGRMGAYGISAQYRASLGRGNGVQHRGDLNFTLAF